MRNQKGSVIGGNALPVFQPRAYKYFDFPERLRLVY